MTRPKSTGHRIEELALYGFAAGQVLSSAERAEFVDFATAFEECQQSAEQLQTMTDKELVSAIYWMMADYVRGQL